MKTSSIIVPLVIMSFLAASCTTPRKASLLLDMATEIPYPEQAAPPLVLGEGDRIDVQVLSSDPELSAPFHVSAGTNEKQTADTYTVSSEGTIDFPVLGSLKVQGLTLRETELLIEDRIQSLGYIKRPTIHVAMDNFMVTVIGESGNAVLPVKSNSINLLEALAATGGVKDNSNLKDVMVIRTENGERTAYSVNLQSRGLFDSPAFYLKQHDIIYVKPQGSRMSADGQTVLAILTPILTIGSIISTFLLWSQR